MPRVAVNIVTYNSAATIGACLEALLAQDGDFDVLVIDNAGQDNTPEIVAQHGVRLHNNADNAGYAVAHNQGIAMTDSEFVLTLNPDVKVQPGFITALRCALENAPQVGSATGCLLRVEHINAPPKTIDSMGLYMRRSGRQGLYGDGEPATNRSTTPRRVFGPDGAAAFYRRAMLDDIAIDGEVFDADFYIHKEDIDLCWRAVMRGWESVYVPDAVAHHIRGFRPGQRARVSARLRQYAVRNRYLLMMKNLPLPLFWRFAPHILAYDAGVLGYMLLRERDSLPALAEAWHLRDKMFAKRAHIMANRQITDGELGAWFKQR